MKPEKLLARLVSGQFQNISFGDFVALMEKFGFSLARTKGSHHIFRHSAIPELINLQDAGGKAKPYQIRQFLRLLERYNLPMEDR